MATRTYTPSEIARNRQSMLDRVRGGTEEQVAIRDQSQRDRYRSFLSDRGEDPDMIGNARINRNTNDAGLTRANYFTDMLGAEEDPVARAYALRQLQREQSTLPSMTLPTWVEEEAANQAIADAQGISSRYGAAAGRLRDRGDYAGAQRFQDARMAYQGPRSSELNRRMWLDIFQNPSPYRQRFGYSANGY